ncbi:MAG: hypothetical protein ACK5UC_13490, partial [Planctomycetaceae bacterium]
MSAILRPLYCLLLMWLLWIWGSLQAGGLLAAEPFPLILGQRHLFLDDHEIASHEGLTRTLHQPVKRGAVIRARNPNQ